MAAQEKRLLQDEKEASGPELVLTAENKVAYGVQIHLLICLVRLVC